MKPWRKVRFTGVMLSLALLVQLGGCGGPVDPYEQPDAWHPEGTPFGNLAAMLVNPRDLIRGRGPDSPEVKLGGDAVIRLYTNQTRPLAGGSSSGMQAQTGNSASSAGAAVGFGASGAGLAQGNQ